MKNKLTRRLAVCSILAALYAGLTILTSAFSYGQVQFRVAEALGVLCCFDPMLGIGVTAGCFCANILSTVGPFDMLFGTAATALSCFLMGKIRSPWLLPLPNVLLNGLIVGGEMALVQTPANFFGGLVLFGAPVAVGELVVMCLLGIPLFFAVKKSSRLQKLVCGK